MIGHAFEGAVSQGEYCEEGISWFALWLFSMGRRFVFGDFEGELLFLWKIRIVLRTGKNAVQVGLYSHLYL